MVSFILLSATAPKPVMDELIRSGMAATQTKGLAIALIKDGKVESTKVFGVRNAQGAPLEPSTVMYGASLTKSVFAYAVMGLVSEGKLDLDRPLHTYLAKPVESYASEDIDRAYTNLIGLSSDPRWTKLTARHSLTHSTGFANFAFLEPDSKLKFHFDPGTRYGYSGDGLMILPFVLEKGLGLDMNKEIQNRVFAPFGMTKSSLSWRPDFETNYADGFKIDGTIQGHSRRKRVRVAGSMDTTIEDMAKFAAGVASGKRLRRGELKQMTSPQLPITSVAQFPTLLEPPKERPFPQLSAGLGVVTFKGPQGIGFFKGGHDDGTANTWVTLPKGKRSMVILSNDVRAEAMFPAIVKAFLGETGLPWKWEYSGVEFFGNP